MIKNDYNIVVIGMGFIGGFLYPAYQMLLGEKVSTNVFAIKATDKNLKELRSKYPFSITVNNSLEILRKTKPDIVIVSPPPKQIPGVISNVLKPYFDEAREKCIPLPDIYTFGPSPDPRAYYAALGKDINCVKFLPSMAEPFKGVELQKLGGSFLSFVPDFPFPPDRRERAIQVSNLFGKTFIVPHDQSLYGLSSKNTAHTCFEISYAIADVLSGKGYDVSTSSVGSAMRAVYRKYATLKGDGVYSSDIKAIPEVLQPFIEKLTIAWFKGVLQYLMCVGCEKELAMEFHGANFETMLLTVQLATREELEESTRNHATKGGVNEKAIETFMAYFDSQLRRAVELALEERLPESFYDIAEGIAFTINQTVNRHAHRLAIKM